MGISPRVVTQDVTFLWDGVSQRLPKHQVIDVAPGSALERAIGRDKLVPMPGTAPQTLPQEPPEPLAAGGLIAEAEMAHVGEAGPETVASPAEEVPAETVPPQPEKPAAEPVAQAKKQDADDTADDDKDGDDA
jgi:hypothetical protein